MNNFEHGQFKKLIMMEIKTYLFRYASYASQEIFYVISSNGNLDKIMLDQQMNFDKVSIENILGFLKIGGRFCITSMGAIII
jgi:hypothetical protein